MESDLKIICYTGGTCGDLVSSLLDLTDTSLDQSCGKIVHSHERQKLKKPHLFVSNDEKNQYLEIISAKYKSIPSHDLNFHIESKHEFISITVEDLDTAVWAAQRFKQFHRPHVWQEMTKVCGADDVQGYANVLLHFSNMVVQHTNNVVKLEDIISGKLISQLEKITNCELDLNSKDFYHNWLIANNRL